MFETLPYPDAFWRQIARRFQQRRASKDPLPDQKSLRQIRRLRRLSQLHVTTLRAYIEALGGSLDLAALFPGLVIRIKLGAP